MFTAGVFMAAAKFAGTELHAGSHRLGVIIQPMGGKSAVILELNRLAVADEEKQSKRYSDPSARLTELMNKGL